MKKIIVLIFLLLPIIGICQDNLITGWYGNQNSYLIEYGRNIGYDKNNAHEYGVDMGIGYNHEKDITKVCAGLHGIINTYSTWNPMYKMGIVVYDFEGYDVYLGIGVEKNNFHLINKLNLINVATKNFDTGEWIEFGFGYSF